MTDAPPPARPETQPEMVCPRCRLAGPPLEVLDDGSVIHRHPLICIDALRALCASQSSEIARLRDAMVREAGSLEDYSREVKSEMTIAVLYGAAKRLKSAARSSGTGGEG